MNEREIISYIFYKSNCIHPFRVSRILLLAEWKFQEKYGKRLTNIKYIAEPYGFYSDDISVIIKELESTGIIIKKGEKKKCYEYIGKEIRIPEYIKVILDDIIESTKSLSDTQLNRLVINNPKYKVLLK